MSSYTTNYLKQLSITIQIVYNHNSVQFRQVLFIIRYIPIFNYEFNEYLSPCRYVSSNPDHGGVYSILHYVTKFIS